MWQEIINELNEVYHQNTGFVDSDDDYIDSNDMAEVVMNHYEEIIHALQAMAALENES